MRTYEVKTGKRVALSDVIDLDKKAKEKIVENAMEQLEEQFDDLEQWDESVEDALTGETLPPYEEALKASLEKELEEGDSFFIASDGSIYVAAEVAAGSYTFDVPVRIE